MKNDFFVNDWKDLDLKVGDVFSTEDLESGNAEHFKILGFSEDGTPKCQRVSEEEYNASK